MDVSSLYEYQPIYKKLNFTLITTISMYNRNKNLDSPYNCLLCNKTTFKIYCFPSTLRLIHLGVFIYIYFIYSRHKNIHLKFHFTYKYFFNLL